MSKDKQRDGGGPAFPQMNDRVLASWAGMSLRDYFAANCYAAAWQAFEAGYFKETDWDSINDVVSRCAYQMADALLVARDVGNPSEQDDA